MDTTIWTEEKVMAALIGDLQAHLPLAWSARKYSPADIWRAVLGAAAQATSLHQFTATSAGSPHSNRIFEILRAQSWWTLEEVEQRVNKLLRQAALLLGKGPVPLAIDLHLQPYWGEKDGVARGGKAQQGTKLFHTYATLCVLLPDRLLTLAVTVVRPGDTMAAVVERLLGYVEPLQLWIKRALLDRQFFAAEVMATLQLPDIPFIIPVRRTGKAKTRSGTQRLFIWDTAGWTVGQLPRKDADPVRFDVAIDVVIEKGKPRALPYATHGLPQTAPTQVATHYRDRNGIEFTYRAAYEARIKTSSPDPVYRLLRFALSLALVNAWLALRFDLGERRPGRGGRRLPEKFCAFEQFRGWLTVAVRQYWLLRPPETVEMQRWRTPQRRRLYRPVRQRRRRLVA